MTSPEPSVVLETRVVERPDVVRAIWTESTITPTDAPSSRIRLFLALGLPRV